MMYRFISQVWMNVSQDCVHPSIKADRLTKGNEYIFRIRAQNRFGSGPALTSSSVSIKHPFNIPGPPGQPVVTHVTKYSANVKWNEPVKDGGSAVIGYVIEHKDKASTLWKVGIFKAHIDIVQCGNISLDVYIVKTYLVCIYFDRKRRK